MKRLLLIVLTLLALTATGCKAANRSNDLYALAVRDAAFADADEIARLVEVTKEESLITWNEDGDKVLMLSWHKYPDSYISGQEFVCSYGEVWTFTDKEIIKWYKANGKNVTDWNLRFSQLIGLPQDGGYTHFSAFWVDEEELLRPAYQTDITKQISAEDLNASLLGDFKRWFDDNIIWSYYDSQYPWTRLGYTYDWADNKIEYGLTEFIILENSTIEVEFTMTTEEFVEWLKTQ